MELRVKLLYNIFNHCNSLAEAFCFLTFPSGYDGAVCCLTLDLQEAAKLLSACHRDLACPHLFS